MLASYTDGWCYKLLRRLDPVGAVTASHFDVVGGTAGWTNLYSTPTWTVRNSGVSASTTATMRTRFAPDVLAYPADYLLILAGYNDTPNGQPYIDSTTIPNITSMCDQAVTAGMIPVLGLITPTAQGTAPRITTAAYLNGKITDLATARGYGCIDFCSPLELTAGTLIGNGGLYVDANHPDQCGSTAMVNAIDTADLGVVGGSVGDVHVWAMQPDGTAGIDCAIKSANVTGNYATETVLGIGDDNPTTANANRTLLRIPANYLTEIPAGATIVGATVSMWEASTAYTTVTSANLTLHRSLRLWQEAEATYTNYATAAPWGATGGIGDADRVATPSASLTLDAVAAGNFVSWSGVGLAADIQAWHSAGENLGWLLDSTGNAAGTTGRAQNAFYSSDFTTVGRRPKYAIEYTLEEYIPPVPVNVICIGGDIAWQ